ncbi:hypothetical protein BGX31_000654 [Mortierella sp. GBA43]|nr:hypothetical protein BGX31_000654 [Mortierella sp. GBA43]
MDVSSQQQDESQSDDQDHDPSQNRLKSRHAGPGGNKDMSIVEEHEGDNVWVGDRPSQEDTATTRSRPPSRMKRYRIFRAQAAQSMKWIGRSAKNREKRWPLVKPQQPLELPNYYKAQKEQTMHVKQIKEQQEQMVLDQTFYNTVAPIRGYGQHLRHPRYVSEMEVLDNKRWVYTKAFSYGMAVLGEDDKSVMEKRKRKYDMLKETMDETIAKTGGYSNTPSPKRFRFSQKCTSCILQGFDCSGDRPVCSQCYHSTAKATSVIALGSLPSSLSTTSTPCTREFCSYPVEATPLMPKDLAAHMSPVLNNIGNSRYRLQMAFRPALEATKGLMMDKDPNQDVGWKLGFPTKPALDKNPATSVDSLFKASSPRQATVYRRPFVSSYANLLFKKPSSPSSSTPPPSEQEDQGQQEKPNPFRHDHLGFLTHHPRLPAQVALEAQNLERLGITRLERSLAKKEGLKTIVAAQDPRGRIQPGSRLLLMRKQHDLLPKLANPESMFRLVDEEKWDVDKPLFQKRTALVALNQSTTSSVMDQTLWGGVDSVYASQGKIARKAKAIEKEYMEQQVQERSSSSPVVESVPVDDSEAAVVVPEKDVNKAESETHELDFGDFKSEKKARPPGSRFFWHPRSASLQTKSRKRTEKEKPVIDTSMETTYRPWVPKKDEKVIPSSCGVPQKAFLQAIHYYASYYYTHANPCPDVFEAMDLPSHIALGMIIQEVIADFAFKLGKESQVEDIAVKQEKLEFARNLAAWDRAAARGRRPPCPDKGLEMDQGLEATVKKQRQDERQYINTMRRRWAQQCRRAKIRARGGDDDGAEEGFRNGGPILGTDTDQRVDSKYWEELRYLKQKRFHPREAVSKRFLVNGYETDVEGGMDYDQEPEEEQQQETRSLDDQRADLLKDMMVFKLGKDHLYESNSDGSDGSDEPDEQDKSDEQDVSSTLSTSDYSEVESEILSSEVESEILSSEVEDISEAALDTKSSTKSHHLVKKEIGGSSGQSFKRSFRSMSMDSDIDEMEDIPDLKKVRKEEEFKASLVQYTTGSNGGIGSIIKQEIQSHAVSTLDKSVSKMTNQVEAQGDQDDQEDQEDQLRPVLTTLNNTRFGMMFQHNGKYEEGSDDDADESDDDYHRDGVISQVVMDDSSSEDDAIAQAASEDSNSEDDAVITQVAPDDSSAEDDHRQGGLDNSSNDASDTSTDSEDDM